MKTYVITGATGFIGESLFNFILENSREEKIKLILAARNVDKLNKLKNKVKQKHFDIEYCSFNFEDDSSYSKLVALSASGLDGVVIMPPRPVDDNKAIPSRDIWEKAFNASFLGPVELIRQLVPSLMIKQGGVVFISGITSCQPLEPYITNTAIKTAWLGFLKTCADKYGKHKVRFNSISLGGIMTDRFNEKVYSESKRNNIAVSDLLSQRFANVPLKKYATLDEVSDLIYFLLTSKASHHMTGQNVVLDGGFVRKY